MKMNWYISKSKIHGDGVFAGKYFYSGEKIDIGIEYFLWMIPRITYFGSKINHSCYPNVILKYHKGEYIVMAIKNIQKDEEIIIDYNKTPWFIENAQDWYV